MKRVITAGTLALGLTWGAAAAGQSREQATGAHADHSQQPKTMAAGGAHAHGPSVPGITYAELQQTTEQLAAARKATAKYQDVRAAEADGYRAIGPNVPGMGIHYVRKRPRLHSRSTSHRSCSMRRTRRRRTYDSLG